MYVFVCAHTCAKLTHLDLSHNYLDIEHVIVPGIFPPSLHTLVLSGNPCCMGTRTGDDDQEEDFADHLIATLQIAYPNLVNILVAVDGAGHLTELSDERGATESAQPVNSEAAAAEWGEGEGEGEDGSSSESPPLPTLSVDEVLREVVDRNCRMQAMDLMDVSQLVQVGGKRYVSVSMS